MNLISFFISLVQDTDSAAVVQRSTSHLSLTSSKMGLGGIHLSGLGMTLEKTSTHACGCQSCTTLVHPFITHESLSYQRMYFRNANHPTARPSVTERRQDVRNSTEGGEDKK